MKISVVIPAFNEQDRIKKTLESLLWQSVKPKEVIVVDNNSKDGTVKMCEQFAERFEEQGIDFKIVSEKNQGVAFARNCGFLTATGDIIASTDADSKVSPDWLAQIKKHFENNESVGVTGKIIFDDNKIASLMTRMGWYWILHHLGKVIFGFMSVHTANCAVDADKFRQAGGFDVSIVDPVNCDDFEMSTRLALHGPIHFNSDMLVYSSFRRYNSARKMIVSSSVRIKKWFILGRKYREMSKDRFKN